MADRKLSALTARTTPATTDELYIIAGGLPYRIPLSSFSIPGLWTPTIEGSVTPGSHTYTTQYGSYLRTGKIVHFQCFIVLSAKDAAMSGEFRIAGLPFVSAAGIKYYSVSTCYVSGVTLTASGYFLQGYVQSATQYIIMTNSNGALNAVLTDASVTNNTTLMVSGMYEAA